MHMLIGIKTMVVILAYEGDNDIMKTLVVESSLSFFLLLSACCNVSKEAQDDNIVLSREDNTSSVVFRLAEVEFSPDGDASVCCEISNCSTNVIFFFEIGDDGFGCLVEKLINGVWQKSGHTWCAAGRRLIRLGQSEVYKFHANLPPCTDEFRLLIEYWENEPFVTLPKHVESSSISVSLKAKPE